MPSMPPKRILLWHAWLLEGTGSNVYTAKVAEVWRRQGHEVVVVCQERRVARLEFVDALAHAGPGKMSRIGTLRPGARKGRVIVVRPEIGDVLPVFVYDEYEGFEVKRFVDLEDGELDRYLDVNVRSLEAIVHALPPDAVIAGHVVPGPVVARRALGDGAYVAKVHGSDLEYAVKLQERYARLGREGLEGATLVVGASRDVLARTAEVAPLPADRFRVIPPGVDVDRWRPRERADAYEEAARLLASDGETARGRRGEADRDVDRLLRDRDAEGLHALARSYDQVVPDPEASATLSRLGALDGVLLGYLGKLIPEKGVERFIEALVLLGPEVSGLIVGFGLFREWLAALVLALDAGDVDAHRWLAEASPMQLELTAEEVRGAAGLGKRVTFTGRLDHRYAPEAVAGMDALIVPSTLDEAFGMVAAEGAAAGALPVVARHSSLAEVAEAVEGAIGRPEALSFEPGPGATRRLADRLASLLAEPPDDRRGMARTAREHVAVEWTWERTADRLLQAAS
jgi:glycosyltransferase involved in cell wall biosynthesis